MLVEQARRDAIKGIVRYKTSAASQTAETSHDSDDDEDEEKTLEAEANALDAAEAMNVDHDEVGDDPRLWFDTGDHEHSAV